MTHHDDALTPRRPPRARHRRVRLRGRAARAGSSSTPVTACAAWPGRRRSSRGIPWSGDVEVVPGDVADPARSGPPSTGSARPTTWCTPWKAARRSPSATAQAARELPGRRRRGRARARSSTSAGWATTTTRPVGPPAQPARGGARRWPPGPCRSPSSAPPWSSAPAAPRSRCCATSSRCSRSWSRPGGCGPAASPSPSATSCTGSSPRSTSPPPAGRVLEIGGPEVLHLRGDDAASTPRSPACAARLSCPCPLLNPGCRRCGSAWSRRCRHPLPARSSTGSATRSWSRRPAGHRRAAPRAHRRSARRGRDGLARGSRASTWRRGGRSAGTAPSRRPTPRPTDPDWAGGTLLDRRASGSRRTAPPAALFAAVSGVGGHRGWYAADWLWEVRGLLDRAVGGIGLRRGRRHPDELRVGDALDFWRVDAYEPPSCCGCGPRCACPAEPGWSGASSPTAMAAVAASWTSGRSTTRGACGGGRYWYALLPFHAVIFGRLARALVAAAEAATSGGGPTSSPSQSTAAASSSQRTSRISRRRSRGSSRASPGG